NNTEIRCNTVRRDWPGAVIAALSAFPTLRPHSYRRRKEVKHMSGYKRYAVGIALATATAALAVTFTGVASGAAPALPSAIISVHANPGHVSTRIVGTSCGGFITVEAVGKGGGYGRVACGNAAASASASPGGNFDFTYASPTQAGF